MGIRDTQQLLDRLRQSRFSQDALAQAIGIDRSALSRILRGLRGMPTGFEERAAHALEALENAEAAAETARRKVMARAGLAS